MSSKCMQMYLAIPCMHGLVVMAEEDPGKQNRHLPGLVDAHSGLQHGL